MITPLQNKFYDEQRQKLRDIINRQEKQKKILLTFYEGFKGFVANVKTNHERTTKAVFGNPNGDDTGAGEFKNTSETARRISSFGIKYKHFVIDSITTESDLQKFRHEYTKYGKLFLAQNTDHSQTDAILKSAKYEIAKLNSRIHGLLSEYEDLCLELEDIKKMYLKPTI